MIFLLYMYLLIFVKKLLAYWINGSLLSITKVALFLSFIHSFPLFCFFQSSYTTLDHVIYNYVFPIIWFPITWIHSSNPLLHTICTFCNSYQIKEPYVNLNMPISLDESSLLKSFKMWSWLTSSYRCFLKNLHRWICMLYVYISC